MTDTTVLDAAGQWLEKASRQPDLPSLPSLMPEVRRLARCDLARLQALSAVLLKDPGLSQRLLRLVNASFYRGAGAGEIVTISRAVAVMGFDAIGRLAVGARLVDTLLRSQDSLALREDCLRALLSALLADQLADGRGDSEDAYLAGLFRNLGRMLASLHAPALRQCARAAVAAELWPRGDAEDRAAHREIGRSFAEAGQQLARQWGWPALLGQCMSREAAASGRFGTLHLAALADDLADLMLWRPSEQWRESLQVLALHPDGPGLSRIEAALGWARLRLADLAALLELPLGRFPAWGGAGADGGSPGTAGRTAASTPVGSDALAEPAAELMSLAIQELSAALVEGGTALEGAPALAIEALWRGLDARTALLFLRHADGSLRGGFGLARGGPTQWQQRCRIEPEGGADLFAVLCRSGVDTVIEDAREPRIAQRLPPWFREGPDAPRFMVLPMRTRGRTLGMIYLDADSDAQLRPDAQQLRLARSLRNQLVLALPAPAA